MRSKIKKRWKWIPIWKTRSFVPQLVKEGMPAPLEWLYATMGCIGEGGSDEIHGILGCFGSKNFSPLACLDLREFEFGIVGVHGADFFSGWGA